MCSDAVCICLSMCVCVWLKYCFFFIMVFYRMVLKSALSRMQVHQPTQRNQSPEGYLHTVRVCVCVRSRAHVRVCVIALNKLRGHPVQLKA